MTKNISIMTENEISYQIRGAIYDVYNSLGPGLLENVYEAALIVELRDHRSLNVKQQEPMDVYYKGTKLNVDYRLDLIVEDKVIIELKSVEEMKKVFFLQLKTYLKIADKRLGILVNFNCEDINSNIWRIVNNI